VGNHYDWLFSLAYLRLHMQPAQTLNTGFVA
jgi:hypothetical protein